MKSLKGYEDNQETGKTHVIIMIKGPDVRSEGNAECHFPSWLFHESENPFKIFSE